MAATIYLERLAGKRLNTGRAGRSPGTRLRTRAAESGRGRGAAGEGLTRSGRAPGDRARLSANSRWVNPAAQQAELVAFRVREHVPADFALADVGRPGAEIEQPAQLGVLLAVCGVEIQV